MITKTIVDKDQEEAYQVIKAFDITIKLIRNHLKTHKKHMNQRIISFLTSELSYLKNQKFNELKKLNISK